MEAMGAATTSLITFEEFERLPEQPGKRELLDGEVIQMPPGDYEHNSFGEYLFVLLRDVVAKAHDRREALDLGKVHHEMGYRLPGNRYVQPDVSITHAAQARKKYLMDAPALALEVVSESNTAPDMEKKVALYFGHGAREVWRLYRDPLHFVIHFGDTSRTIWEGSLTTPLLPGFQLPLTALEALLGQ